MRELRPPEPQEERGTVVSYCPIASSIGSLVLWEGGNAADAAIATAIALAVTYPQAGNLGGGGFALYAPSVGGAYFLDFRETAPRKVEPRLYLDEKGERNQKSLLGAMAVGVPGTVAGLAELAARFGSWSWDRLLEPCIDLAEHGVWLTTRQASYMARFAGLLSEFDSSRRFFLRGEQTFLPGTLFRQPELGRALRLLAKRGPRDFYEGTLAYLIADEIERGGGLLDLDDLSAYRPRWRDPVRRSYFGREVYSPPLPSGGGFVLSLALGILEANGIEGTKQGTLERYMLYLRAFRVAFALRHKLAADPDWLSPAQLDEIASHLMQRVGPEELLRLERELLAAPPKDARESVCTTHIATLDRDGNAASITYSLNTLFGSKLAVGGAGFLLNNTIDDFKIGMGSPNWYGFVDGPRNELAPGRRPVGSMSPTIVRQSPTGPVELAIGASGGPMIPTLITQVLTSMFADDMRLVEALAAPRVHHQFMKPEIHVERAIPEGVIRGLAALGDPITSMPRLAIGAAIHKPRDGSDPVSTLDARFGQHR